MLIVEFLLILTGSVFLISAVRKNAVRFGLLDVPNERSTHKRRTARGAGIGFYLAVALILPIFHFDLLLKHLPIFVAIMLVFIVGLLDDHRDTSPKTKFVVIILSTLLLSIDHLYIDNLGVFFGANIHLGLWAAIPLTVFAVVGFTNALNLIDGLDGLAGTVSLVILGSFLYVGCQHDDMFMIVLSGSFIAALLGFLYFNWHPASIFMGDSGSLTLGFVIAVLAIRSLEYIPAVSILFIAALPILDTIIVMVRRKMKGRSMFEADRCHTHHIMRHFFHEDTPRTVVAFGVMQIIYSLTALQIDKTVDSSIVILLFIMNVVLMYLFLAAMIKRQKRDC